MEDDIPQEVKKRRLAEIIDKQQAHSRFRTEEFLGKTVCVLIEKESKRSKDHWSGRTTQNTVVVFPKKEYNVGEFVDVEIKDCTSATLLGTPLGISSNI